MRGNLGKKKLKAGAINRLIINVLAVASIIFLMIVVIRINTSKEETIGIVRVKSDIYTNQLIKESNLEKYEMVRREFDNSGGDYLKWDEYEDCVDKYSSVFVRKGGYIVKGDYLDYKPIKNPWMEEASSNSVFVTLKYDRGEAFGNILTPGDRVKVNVSYSAEDEASHDIFSGAVTRIKIKNLFEDIMITDLLNSKGNSIYDYYTDVLNLPLAEREALLRDENFLNNVAPVSMILEIDKDEEFRTYSELKNLTGVKYTFGLHPRQEGDIVIDQFKDLTRQITQNQTQMQSQQGDDK